MHLEVEVWVEEEPERDAKHAQPQQPEEEVDGEDEELEEGVAARHDGHSCASPATQLQTIVRLNKRPSS